MAGIIQAGIDSGALYNAVRIVIRTAMTEDEKVFCPQTLSFEWGPKGKAFFDCTRCVALVGTFVPSKCHRHVRHQRNSCLP